MQINQNIAYEANPRQQEFHAAPEKYKLYGGAMGGGKTWALCAEAIALSCDYPGNRGYICRHTSVSFQRTTFLTLDGMLKKTDLVEQHYKSSPAYYSFKNGSRIYYGGLGDDISAIDKLKSMELGWFAIDEASETTESYFLMLCSRLRLQVPGIKYFGIMGTNPDPGWLKHRFIDQKLVNHLFIPALPRDNKDLPDDYVSELEEVFPREWQKRFIEGDWAAFEGANNVFPYQAILNAFEKDMEPGEPVEIGVDVARYGDNESIIVLRRGSKVELLDKIPKSDLMYVTGKIMQRKDEYNPTEIKVDADGMGAGVVDRLTEQNVGIMEIHGGGKARDSERFANLKAEIHWGFRERLLNGDVDLPNDMKLKAQLTSIEYKVKSSGQYEIVSKEEMKKREIESPDRAEAVIYAFAEIGGGAVGIPKVGTGDIWA
jgi:PBSX family phage terminase large subunit